MKCEKCNEVTDFQFTTTFASGVTWKLCGKCWREMVKWRMSEVIKNRKVKK